MRLVHWLAALVIAGVVFVAGRFALGALGPADWHKDLLPMPPRSAAASAPATSAPAVVAEVPALPASAPAVVDGVPTLQTFAGIVERKGRVGRWQTVSEGDRFDPGSSLRTGTESSASVAIGTAAAVAFGDSTTIQFDKELTKFWLDAGEVKVQVKDGGEPVEISGRDSRARVRGARGAFAVRVKPGLLVVAAEDAAEVELIAAGKTVTLGANTISWVAPGRPPVEPFAADHKPELTVVEPKVAKVATPTIVIKGQTEPLTEVTVNDVAAKVDARGAFSAVVPLVDGDNAIAVVARLFTGTESRYELNPITRVKKAAAPAGKKPAIKWGPGQ